MTYFTRRSALAASVAAYAVLRGAPARAADKLRIAALPQDAGLEPLYAVNSGIAAKYGIDFDVQVLTNGGAIISAVIGGTLDIGSSNTLTVLQARDKGVPVIAIAPGAIYSTRQPTTVLMIAKNAPYKSAQDLNGKIVAVDGLRNISEFATRGWMHENGGDASSLKFTEMPFATMSAALQSGRIDVALVPEPFVTLGLDRARVFAKAYDSIAPEFQLGLYFATESWASANPDLVRRVQQVLQSAGAWSNANQVRTGAWLQKTSSIDPAVISAMTRARWGEKLDFGLVTPVIAQAVKYSAITKAVAPRDLFATAVQ